MTKKNRGAKSSHRLGYIRTIHSHPVLAYSKVVPILGNLGMRVLLFDIYTSIVDLMPGHTTLIKYRVWRYKMPMARVARSMIIYRFELQLYKIFKFTSNHMFVVARSVIEVLSLVQENNGNVTLHGDISIFGDRGFVEKMYVRTVHGQVSR